MVAGVASGKIGDDSIGGTVVVNAVVVVEICKKVFTLFKVLVTKPRF